jgi:hypothetical protein
MATIGAGRRRVAIETALSVAGPEAIPEKALRQAVIAAMITGARLRKTTRTNATSPRPISNQKIDWWSVHSFSAACDQITSPKTRQTASRQACPRKVRSGRVSSAGGRSGGPSMGTG